MSDALHLSSRYDALYGKEDVDFVMYEACMRSRNVTSVATDRNSTKSGSPARAFCRAASDDAVDEGR